MFRGGNVSCMVEICAALYIFLSWSYMWLVLRIYYVLLLSLLLYALGRCHIT
jgi:hypothetical protein